MIHRNPQRAAVSLRPEATIESVSIVIPVLNEESLVARTLDSLLAQVYPRHRYDIYVVDGASTDGTREVVQRYVQRYPQVHLLQNPQRWSSAARNIGVRASRGDIVVIVDGHCQIDTPFYLANLVAAFRRSNGDCVGRPQPLDVTGGTALQRAIAVARASLLGHHPDSYVYSYGEHFVPAHSVGVAYRRSVFQAVGYFDESFDACEDVEFNHRVDLACLRCFLTPSVKLRYYPRDSFLGLFNQLSRYGRGRTRLVRKHPRTFSITSFLPAVFVTALVVGGVGACFSRAAALGMWGLLLTYQLTIVGYSLFLSWRMRNLHLLPWLPLVFATIHLAAGCGSLQELLAGRRLSKSSTTTGAFLTPGSRPTQSRV